MRAPSARMRWTGERKAGVSLRRDTETGQRSPGAGMKILNAAEARRRAREFRERAIRETEPALRSELKQIATHYDLLAHELERLDKQR